MTEPGGVGNGAHRRAAPPVPGPDGGAGRAPRYSARPFPPYAYVPGKTPHPTRDPKGHSRGHPPEPLESFDPASWRECEPYLYGVDLFNHGYWWEAHEALEGVWVAAGRHTHTGLFLQGLIQISVAHLKRHQGFADVAARMAARGSEKLGPGGSVLGIDVARARADVRASFTDASGAPVVFILEV